MGRREYALSQGMWTCYGHFPILYLVVFFLNRFTNQLLRETMAQPLTWRISNLEPWRKTTYQKIKNDVVRTKVCVIE